MDEWWRREQKYKFLEETASADGVEWERLAPNARGTWINSGDENFSAFLPLGSKEAKAGKTGAAGTIFETFSGGVKTNRDDWAYDFNSERLVEKMQRFIAMYNSEVDRWNRAAPSDRDSVDNFVIYDDKRIKWSGDLKAHLVSGEIGSYQPANIRLSLYRPYVRQHLYFDALFNNRRYLHPYFFPTDATMCVRDSAPLARPAHHGSVPAQPWRFLQQRGSHDPRHSA